MMSVGAVQYSSSLSTGDEGRLLYHQVMLFAAEACRPEIFMPYAVTTALVGHDGTAVAVCLLPLQQPAAL